MRRKTEFVQHFHLWYSSGLQYNLLRSVETKNLEIFPLKERLRNVYGDNNAVAFFSCPHCNRHMTIPRWLNPSIEDWSHNPPTTLRIHNHSTTNNDSTTIDVGRHHLALSAAPLPFVRPIIVTSPFSSVVCDRGMANINHDLFPSTAVIEMCEGLEQVRRGQLEFQSRGQIKVALAQLDRDMERLLLAL